MGTDAIFNAVFLAPKPAAARFSELWDFLSKRPGFHGPGQVRVYELIDTASPLAIVEGYASDPTVAAQVKGLLAQYSADRYTFRGTWGIRGEGNGRHPTHYGVEVTFRAPLIRHDPRFDRDIDVEWDIGDSRRYFPERDHDFPSAAQVISDLQVLIALGACSIWGSTERIVSPLELYAVYHRDLNEYGSDGLDEPFPKCPIEEAHVEVAVESANKQYEEGDRLALWSTGAGPLVYSPLLALGTLNMFYSALDEMMKAEVRAQIEETNAADYRAFKCNEAQREWILVERRSDGAEIVRIEALQQDADVLTIAYKIIEPGLNDIILRELVPLAVLRGLYNDSYRGSVTRLRYQNVTNETEDLVPYD